MEEVNVIVGEQILVHLSGHIDSNNAAAVEAEVLKAISAKNGLTLVIDAEQLKYISSAGLRILLHLKKNFPDMKVINVGSDVYEILEMTGFTQIMPVEKAYREVSVEGCEVIGQGANGTIYRIDMDNVVKLYNDANALEEIRHEREVARTALVLGIPTAISYDVVRVGDSYGSVFELLNAQSFSKILANEPERFDWCVQEYVGMLRKIHGTLVPSGELPDLKETVVSWARFMKDYLPEEAGKKLLRMVQAVPHCDYMVHGDYHTNNLQRVEGDEVLLIDLDTLAVGDPIFDLASMFNAFRGYGENDKSVIPRFLKMTEETASNFWYKVLATYIGTNDPEEIRQVEDKARIIGYTRMIRRSIRRGGLEQAEKKAEIDLWTKELLELLDRTENLQFRVEELVVESDNKQLPRVMEFIDDHFKAAGCPVKAIMQIDIAVEEIFSNIANYAYKPGVGEVSVHVDIPSGAKEGRITFTDTGAAYDPLAREDPDVTLSAEQREIGGLGIYMAKKSMDEMTYEYKDGKNILTMKKRFIP